MTRFRLINWWISKTWGTLHLLLALGGIGICLTGAFAKMIRLEVVGKWWIGILLFVHMIHAVLHRLQILLKQSEEIDLIPVRQIKQVTGFYLILFLLMFAFVSWVGIYFPWGVAGEWIWTVLVKTIRMFTGLFFGEKEQIAEEIVQNPESGGIWLMPIGETSLLARILDQVLAIVFWIAIMILAVLLCFHLIRRFLKWMSTIHFDGDERIFLEPGFDGTERIEHTDSEQGKGRLMNRMKRVFDRSINGQIRSRYRKILRQGFSLQEKDFDVSSCTPEELELQAGWKLEDETRILVHELYEKARYSKMGCEREELEVLKQQKVTEK